MGVPRPALAGRSAGPAAAGRSVQRLQQVPAGAEAAAAGVGAHVRTAGSPGSHRGQRRGTGRTTIPPVHPAL